ncbi:MAG: tail-specific protease [Rhodobacterales bacterium]|nr:tail-specific protease [Rhodobacterales bacterium]
MRRFVTMVPLALLLALVPNGGNAGSPPEVEPMVTAMVSQLMQFKHLTNSQMNDETSSRWLDRYLYTLDANRMYFLASDIQEFEKYRDILDDDLGRGAGADLQPSREIWEVCVKRRAERYAFALAELEREHDFSADESFVLDRRDKPWATNSAELDELWRKQVTEQLLSGVLAKVDPAERVEQLQESYQIRAKQDLEMEEMDVLEYYLSALTSLSDPHSRYFKPAERDNFEIDLSNSVEGIGAVLRVRREYTTIEDLVPGGPAKRSLALQKGDRIVAVAQGDEDATQIVGYRIDKVVKLIRGKKGTVVNLTILPVDAEDPTATKVVTIIRDKVVLKDKEAKSEIHEVTGPNGDSFSVGVINVPTFYAPVGNTAGVNTVSADVKILLETLNEANVDAVVVDLRENTGGSLSESIDLTGLFIDKGPVVQVRDRNNVVDIYKDRKAGQIYDGPLVVLTSPYSASASEIFAGAIQDYDRGVIVGSPTTHGKGSVQTVIGLDQYLMGIVPDMEPETAGMLKLTTALFYRVNGASTQGRGIEADVIVPTPYVFHEYEKDLDDALAWDEIPAASFKSSGNLDGIIPQLATRSASRVDTNEVLQRFDDRAAKWLAEKDENKPISLNLETRKAEREKLMRDLGIEDEDEDKETPPDGEDSDPEETVSMPDDVLQEALMVAIDLIELTR